MKEQVVVMLVVSLFFIGFGLGMMVEKALTPAAPDLYGLWFQEYASNESVPVRDLYTSISFNIGEYRVHISLGSGYCSQWGTGGYSNDGFCNIAKGAVIDVECFLVIGLNWTINMTTGQLYPILPENFSTLSHIEQGWLIERHAFELHGVLTVGEDQMLRLWAETSWGEIGWTVTCHKMGTEWWN